MTHNTIDEQDRRTMGVIVWLAIALVLVVGAALVGLALAILGGAL
jgi:hypothetical protein